MPRLVVFAITDWYLPGNKGGGAVSAISNLIELLGEEFEFYVFTRNRDSTEEGPYAGICFDQWVPSGKAKVFYASEVSLRTIRRCIREVGPQVVYLNSFFSRLTMKVLLLRKCGLLPRSAVVVLAPRGEFFPGALEVKPMRKRLYLRSALRAGLYADVLWQASSDSELRHILAAFSRNGQADTAVHIAQDLPGRQLFRAEPRDARGDKQAGRARFVFLSRISRNKNLLFVLGALSQVDGQVEFNLYGPIGDAAYWRACRERIRTLPAHVVVRYCGAVAQDHVPGLLAEHDFLLLPTLGENFGYAILEALSVGCPVVISDQTPWRGLQAEGVGWDMPLDAECWRKVLQECVDMTPERHRLLAQRAREFAREWISSNRSYEQHVELFRRALGGNAAWKSSPVAGRSAPASE